MYSSGTVGYRYVFKLAARSLLLLLLLLSKTICSSFCCDMTS
jgi:hypothetical protein